jgi:hypothetical protein
MLMAVEGMVFGCPILTALILADELFVPAKCSMPFGIGTRLIERIGNELLTAFAAVN